MAAGELHGPRRDGRRRRGTDGEDGRLPRHGPARGAVRRVSRCLLAQLPVRVHPVAGQDDQGHPVVLAPRGSPETLVMDGGAGPRPPGCCRRRRAAHRLPPGLTAAAQPVIERCRRRCTVTGRRGHERMELPSKQPAHRSVDVCGTARERHWSRPRRRHRATVARRSAGLAALAVLPRLVAAAADLHRAPVAGAVLGVVVEGPLAGVVAAGLEPRPGVVLHRAVDDHEQAAEGARPRPRPRPRAARSRPRPRAGAGGRARPRRPASAPRRRARAGRRCCSAGARAAPRGSQAARRRSAGRGRGPSSSRPCSASQATSSAGVAELLEPVVDVQRVHERAHHGQLAGRFFGLRGHRRHLRSGFARRPLALYHQKVVY